VKFDNKELRDLHTSPSIIGIIMPWRLQWAGHVEWVEETINTCRILTGLLL